MPNPAMPDPSFHAPSALEAAQAAQVSAENIAEALKTSEIRYRRLFETARDGILILDSDEGKITDSNPFMTELLGYSHDELLGKELWEIGLLKDKEASQEAFGQLERDGYIRYEDLPLENQRGKKREVEFVSNLYPENGHTVIQCNIRDITARREAEVERERTLAQIEAVLTSATDGIIVSDPAGNTLMWNPAGLAMHEYTDLAEARRHLSEFRDTFAVRDADGGAPLSLDKWPLSRVMRGETFTEYELLVERLDTGTIWWASYSGARALGDGGNPLLLVLTVRDISERKRMEAQRVALTEQLRETVEGQRRLLKEMLFGLTEGHMRLCDTRGDLPAELPPVRDPVELTAMTLRLLRQQVDSMTEELRFAKERVYDLKTAASEAAMNALRHGGGGSARVHADPASGVIQVWIRDAGAGIAEHLIHRAVESGWTTGGFGQGFFLMWRTCDRVYLLTGATGTTVVLEMNRTPPAPFWMKEDV